MLQFFNVKTTVEQDSDVPIVVGRYGGADMFMGTVVPYELKG
jgi:hypothetical protein